MAPPIHPDQCSKSLTRPSTQWFEFHHHLRAIVLRCFNIERLVKAFKFEKRINVPEGFSFRVAGPWTTLRSIAFISTDFSFSAMTPLRAFNPLWSTTRAFKSFKILLNRPKKPRVPTRELSDDQTPGTPIIQPSDEPAVPKSSPTLAAPIVDLTNQIRIIDPNAIAHGGFADIHRGEWVQVVGDAERAAVKNTQVCNVFSPIASTLT